MWRYQPKLLRIFSLPVTIGFVSAFVHLLLLFMLLFLYNTQSQYQITITGNPLKSNVPVIFMPMHKSIKSSGISGSKSQPQMSTQKSLPMSAPVKEASGVTLAAQAPAKKISKKEQKKESKKTNEKNKSLNAAAKEKKVADIKTVQKIAQVIKKTDPIIETIKEAIIQNTQENAPTVASTSPIENSNPLEIPGALYVGQEEWDALARQQYIESEMAQHWSPPQGMRQDLVCGIKLVVDREGIISLISVENSSGVLLFDGAAQRAAAQITPPKWSYGKEISLIFKP